MNNKHNLYILLIAIAILLIPNNSLAFRCSNDVFSWRSSSDELLNKCGEPYKKEYTSEYINGNIKSVEIWFYNCGQHDFIYAIYITDLKIIKEIIVKRGSGISQCK